MIRNAGISATEVYRYWLTREWGPPTAPTMAWLMLNPSTADGTVDDPTVRRCIRFAQREHCGSIAVLNLYALRSSTPKALVDHPEPEGASNATTWRVFLADPEPAFIVAAWGAHARQRRLVPSEARSLLEGRKVWCLGTTKAGDPRHPLYVPADRPLEEWCASSQ